MSINVKKILVFLGLTFSLNWLMATLFFMLFSLQNRLAFLAMAIAYMFVPMVMALVVQKLIYKETVKGPLGISFRLNRWWAVAWLLTPLLALATFGVSLLFPGVNYSPGMEGMFDRFKDMLTPVQMAEMRNQIATLPVHPIWLTLIQGLIVGPTINAVAAFGEELGWRGLLQRELEPLGFWPASLLIGLIWGIWHAPLILQGYNYPQHPQFGVLMMALWCLLLGPIFSYIRLRAGSVIAAAILHGTLNATYGLSIMLIQGGNDLTVGLTGLAGFIVLAVVDLGLFLYPRFSPVTTLKKESHVI
jgi:membrane protease YdiL (CAAX protease family)